MRALVIASLAAGLLTAAAPLTAHAGGVAYRGQCGFASVNNPTGDGALGGSTVWTGVMYLYVVPTEDDETTPTGGEVTAWCEITVNGVSTGAGVGPVSGTGAVAAAGPIHFRAGITDVVQHCLHVTTAAGTRVDCPIGVGRLVPQPILDLLDEVHGMLDPVLSPVRDLVVTQSDTTACGALVALAPAVDALARPDLVYTDPATGDTFSGPYLVWDCPPQTP